MNDNTLPAATYHEALNEGMGVNAHAHVNVSAASYQPISPLPTQVFATRTPEGDFCRVLQNGVLIYREDGNRMPEGNP